MYLFQKKPFWKVLALKQKFLFDGFKSVYGFKYWAKETRNKHRSVQSLFKATQLQIVAAFVFASCLQLFDPYLNDFYEVFEFKIFLGVPSG